MLQEVATASSENFTHMVLFKAGLCVWQLSAH